MGQPNPQSGRVDQTLRHQLYYELYEYFAALWRGSDDARSEIEDLIAVLDALYVTGGRSTVGPIDGTP